MKQKRLVALVLAMLMALGLLTGCGSSAEETTAGGSTGEGTTAATEAVNEDDWNVTEPITIQFWYNSQNNVPFYEEIIPEFNAQSEYVTVEAVCVGSYATINDQLSAAHQAQSGVPAVVTMSFPTVPQYYESGVVSNLNELIAGCGIDTDDIVDGLMEQVTVGDDVIALPWGPSAALYFYNKTELAAYGLDEFPTTWEELKVWLKAVTEATGKPALTAVSKQPNVLYTTLLNFGGDLMEADDPTKTALDNENLVARLKEIEELVDAGYINWSMEGEELDVQAFVNQDTMSLSLTCTNYDTFMAAIEELPEDKQFEFGMAWNWSDVYGYSTVAGNAIVVPACISEEERKAAGEFVAWLTSPEIQLRWAEFSCFILIHESNLSDESILASIYEKYPEMENVYPYVAEQYKPKPNSQYYDAVMKEFYTTLQMIYCAGEDFDSTYNEMLENVEYILSGN